MTNQDQPVSVDPARIAKYMADHMAMPHVGTDQEQNWIFGHMVTCVSQMLASRDAEVQELQTRREHWTEHELPFQEWAQGYLNSAKWAGHDRADAIKAELLERDQQLAEAEAARDALHAEVGRLTKEIQELQARVDGSALIERTGSTASTDTKGCEQ